MMKGLCEGWAFHLPPCDLLDYNMGKKHMLRFRVVGYFS